MESEETPPAITDRQIADFFRENRVKKERPEDDNLMGELFIKFVRNILPEIILKPELEPEKILALSNDILAFQKLVKLAIGSVPELIAAMIDKPVAALTASPFYAELIGLAQIKTSDALNAAFPENFPFLVILAKYPNGEIRFAVADKNRFPGVNQTKSGKKEIPAVDLSGINPKTEEPFMVVEEVQGAFKPVKFLKKNSENSGSISGLDEAAFLTFLSALVFLDKSVIRFEKLIDISATFTAIVEALKAEIEDYDSLNPSLKDLREKFGILYGFNRLLEIGSQKSLISIDSPPNQKMILTINIDKAAAERTLEASGNKERWIYIARLFSESI